MESEIDTTKESHGVGENEIHEYVTSDNQKMPRPPSLSLLPTVKDVSKDRYARAKDAVVSELTDKQQNQKQCEVHNMQVHRWSSILFTQPTMPGGTPIMEKMICGSSPKTSPRPIAVFKFESIESSNQISTPLSAVQAEMMYSEAAQHSLSQEGTVASKISTFNQMPSYSPPPKSPTKKKAKNDIQPLTVEVDAVQMDDLNIHSNVASKVNIFEQQETDQINPMIFSEVNGVPNLEMREKSTKRNSSSSRKFFSPNTNRLSHFSSGSNSASENSDLPMPTREVATKATDTEIEIIHQFSQVSPKWGMLEFHERSQGTASLREPPSESYTSDSYSLPSGCTVGSLTSPNRSQSFDIRRCEGFPVGLPPFNKGMQCYYGGIIKAAQSGTYTYN